jgi:DNA polymerase III psi subunit
MDILSLKKLFENEDIYLPDIEKGSIQVSESEKPVDSEDNKLKVEAVAAPHTSQPKEKQIQIERKKTQLLVLAGKATASDTDFVSKITAAVGLSVADYLIAEPQPWQTLVNNYDFQKCLIFGDFAHQNMRAANEPFSIENISLIVSQSLPELQENRALKAQLWKALQQMFGI